MTDALTPTFSVDVDLTNPGQFLACCGLLELASRCNPEAVGWFEGTANGSNQFRLAGAREQLISDFINCSVVPIVIDASTQGISDEESYVGDNAEEQNEAGGEKETQTSLIKPSKSPPIWLCEPFNTRLDWWTDKAVSQMKFKTWSRGQTVMRFFQGDYTGKKEKPQWNPSMREHLARVIRHGKAILQHTEAIASPAPFAFDSRLVNNAAIDLGFVDNVVFAFSPAVELFALVGLQRFRPRMEMQWTRYKFHIWRDPLPVAVAAAVAHGLIHALSGGSYIFAIKPRDKYTKLFGPSRFESMEGLINERFDTVRRTSSRHWTGGDCNPAMAPAGWQRHLLSADIRQSDD